jgi:hypothetical protein
MNTPKILLPIASSLAVVFMGAFPVFAEIPPMAGTVTHIFGTATLQHGLDGEAKPLHFKDKVYLQDTIQTGEESVVRILMGNKALVTVSEMSVLKITEEVNHATLDVVSGAIGLSVARKRMNPGEYIEIRTPHAMAAIRGTKVVAEVANKHESKLTVIEGSADFLTSRSDPKNRIPMLTNQIFEFNEPKAGNARMKRSHRGARESYRTTTVMKEHTYSDIQNFPSQEGTTTNHITHAMEVANQLTQQYKDGEPNKQVAYATTGTKGQGISQEPQSVGSGDSLATPVNTLNQPSSSQPQVAGNNNLPNSSGPSAPAPAAKASAPAPSPIKAPTPAPAPMIKAPTPPPPTPKIVPNFPPPQTAALDNNPIGRRGGDDDRRDRRGRRRGGRDD